MNQDEFYCTSLRGQVYLTYKLTKLALTNPNAIRGIAPMNFLDKVFLSVLRYAGMFIHPELMVVVRPEGDLKL